MHGPAGYRVEWGMGDYVIISIYQQPGFSVGGEEVVVR